MMSHRIPHRLHFIFLNRDEPVPPAFLECYDRARQLHPGWEARIYHEDDAQDILRTWFPALLPVYNAYAHTVQRSDILRVILVHLFGGFYLDMDILCLKSLDELCDQELVLGKERLFSFDELHHHEARHSLRIGNYMFGGRPGHPFWLSILKESIRLSKKDVCYEDDVIRTTGPELLTNVYHQTRLKHKDIVVLGNDDRRCVTQWHDAISCHFGNFAAHLHTGSWRWKGRKSHLPPRQPLPEGVYRNARTDIDARLKRTSVASNDILLLKVDEKALRNRPPLALLYGKCALVCKKVANTRTLRGREVLVLGDPRTPLKKLGAGNIYTLYTMVTESDISKEWVDCLHAYYHHCIVGHHHMKELLVAAGVAIPVSVVKHGFQRTRRNFKEDEEDDGTTFTVACPVTGEAMPEVIAVCTALRKGPVPGLKLRLIMPHTAKTADLKAYKEWVSCISVQELYKGRFRGIHCFLFMHEPGRSSPDPREALYHGIPAIVTDHRLYDDLSASGYCKVIPDGEHLWQALQEVHREYERYNEIAIGASRWIEDKWTLEFTVAEIFGSMTRQSSKQDGQELSFQWSQDH